MTTATTPIWLLDVDGVLNALPYRGESPGGWDDYQSFRCDTDGGFRYLITYSPTLMACIRALHESGAVEIRWLTTWGRGANFRLNKELGLPDFTVAGEPDVLSGFAGAPNHRWWKFDDARRAHEAEPHRPIIWTDDDLSYVPDAHAWAVDKGFLAISTNPITGITPVDIARVVEFIDEHAAAAA